MSKSAVLAIACLGVSASGAFAVDLVLKSQLGQSAEFNDNRNLQPKSNGDAYTFVSTLMFDAVAQTPTMKFAATVDMSYRTYAGPGAVDVKDALDKGARASVEKKDKLTTYNLAGSWSQRDASTVQRQDIGISTVSGDMTTYTVEGGLKRELTPRDTLGWMTRSSSVQFSAPGATNYVSFSTTADWTHRLNPTNDLTGSLQYEWQGLENATNTQTMIWRPIGGVKSQLTRRLTFKGSGGVAIVTTTQDPANNLPAPFPTSDSGTHVGWIADLLLAYKLKTTTISLSAARTIAPSALGDLQQRSTAALNIQQDINQYSFLSFGGSFSHQKAPSANTIPIGQPTFNGSAADVFAASVAYNYRLAREWNTRLSYTFTQRKSDTSTANSNAILFSINHDVTIWRDR